jgi:hypothetical protein
MFLRAWYFVTLILTALLMGTSFAHTLEMPAKMTVDAILWMTFQHTLYPYFAYAGAPIELGAIITAAGLSYSFATNGRGFIRRSWQRFVWRRHSSSSGWGSQTS